MRKIGAKVSLVEPKAAFYTETAPAGYKPENIICHNCGNNKHMARHCKGTKKAGEVDTREKSKVKVVCTYCKVPGHSAQDCRKLLKFLDTKPKESGSNSASISSTIAESIGKVSINAVTTVSVIGLDTCASRHVFGNKALLSNEHLGSIIKVHGYDGHETEANIYCDFGKVGEVLYVPGIGANLLSFKQLLKDGCNISFDRVSEEFQVTKEDMVIGVFKSDKQDIFTCDTVQCNAVTVIPKDHDRARLVQHTHEALGHVNDATLIDMLKNGNVLNTPLVASDVAKSREINGPCEGCIKGKMTHNDATTSMNPSETSIGGLLHMDIMNFNSEMFLISIDECSKHVVTVRLVNKQRRTMELALQKIVNIYKGYNHVVKGIRTDGEAIFISCHDFLKSIFVNPSQTAPENHETYAERCIRSVKDKARSIIYGLSYALPSHLYRYALEHAVSCINMVTNKDHPTETPNQMIMGSKVDVRKDLRAAFGDIGLFRIPYSNTHSVSARAETGIVVGRVHGSHGILKVWVPSRNKIVNRFKFVKSKMTNELKEYLDAQFTMPEEVRETEISEPVDDPDINDPYPYWQPTMEDIDTMQTSDANDPLQAYMTITEALEFNQIKANDAISAEMKQMLDEKVWEPVRLAEIDKAHRANIIPSHMVMKMKYLPDGNEDKMKGRLAAGGNFERQGAETDNTSPTVNTTSFMILLAIASKIKAKMQAIDVKGACLKVALKNQHQYMTINKKIAKILVDMDSEYRGYQNVDGSIIVRLKKALYGLKESSKLWYEDLSTTLKEIGFKKSQMDDCLFFKHDMSGGLVACCIHVDDIFFVAEHEKELETCNQHLKAKYRDITINKGSDISYLGMTIETEKDTGRIGVSQKGYVSGILSKFKVTGTAKTPSLPNMFEATTGDPVDVTDYLSKVMSLMYLAQRTRPDILKEVSYAATKCVNPNSEDLSKVERILKHVNFTQDKRLEIQCTDLDVHAYIDASYASHFDAKSHSGGVISISKSGGTVYAFSGKQKIVTLSSTEAELVAVHDILMRATWIREILLELGLNTGPVILYQDNTSTIHQILHGKSGNFKSRHINVRYFSTREKIENGTVIVEYCPTSLMKADIMTKALQGKLFIDMQSWILNEWPE
jgi:hypothetical protein